jgi:uncharacterized damage-inducible protein DinB
MLPEYARLLARLDSRREALIAELEAMDAATLHFRPEPDAWSIVQVVNHLERVDHGAVQMMQHPTALAGKLRRRPKNIVGYAILRIVLATGIRVSMPPKVKAMVTPSADGSLSELRDRWRESAAALEKYFERFTKADRRRLVALHAVGGPLTPERLLLFIDRHFRHHLRQIRRIRSAAERSARG